MSDEAREKVKEVQDRIAAARGGCVAVRVFAINGDSANIEAEIDPQAAMLCPCDYCTAGDLTTSI